jgi:hypothetical protein
MAFPIIPIVGAALVGSAIGAAIRHLLGDEPKSTLSDGQRVHVSMTNGVSYEGVVLDLTETAMVLGVPGGTARLALADMAQVKVLL